MKPYRLLVFVCLALVMASCSLQQSWAIFGKWQNADGSETIAFSKDGLMTIENARGVSETPFKMADTKHLEVYLGSLATVRFEVAIANDQLTLTHPDGTVLVFTKTK